MEYVGRVSRNHYENDVEELCQDREVSGQNDTGKGIPKTTAEMKQKATFE